MYKLENKQEVEKFDFIEDSYTRGRDLLTVLVKSNADPDIPESQKLSDTEVLAREHFQSTMVQLMLTELYRGTNIPYRRT